MRQLVYISSATLKGDQTVLPDILGSSQRNNRRAGITGLLYGDGRRFLQAIEGEEMALEQTLARIRLDPRHRAMVILSDRRTAGREFGGWAMAERRPGEDAAAFLAQVSILVAGAAPDIRATFEGFVGLRPEA